MRRIIGLSLLLIALGVLAAFGLHRWWNAGLDEPLPVAPRTTSASEAAVEKFCSTCHVLAPPDVEPQHLWPEKIKEMYGYATSGRAWPETQMPPIQDPIQYFTSRARPNSTYRPT